jgi:cell division protein YceG involved in septum cleavage
VKRAFLALVVLILLAGAGVAGMLYKRTSEPFKGYEGAEQFVTIEPGSGSRTIAQRLIAAMTRRFARRYGVLAGRAACRRASFASTAR